MRVKTSLKVLFVLFVLCLSSRLVYSDDDTLTAETAEKQEIQRIYTKSDSMKKDLEDKIEQDKKYASLANIREQIQEFFTLAKSLEEMGDYENAAKCYQKILRLTKDPHIKKYIKQKSKELKELSTKQRDLAKKRVETKTKELASRKKERERDRVKKRKEIAVEKVSVTEKAVTPKEPVFVSIGPARPKKKAEPREEARQETPVKPEVTSVADFESEREEAEMEEKIDSAKSMIEQGDRLYQKKRYEEAYALYKKAFDSLK